LLTYSRARLSYSEVTSQILPILGAVYEPRGYYRPQSDCVMFTRDDVPFCRVCQRAITRVIDLYAARAIGPA